MHTNDTVLSPWSAARQEFGGNSVLRVIDIVAGTDEFQRIEPQESLGDMLLDGCTLIRTDHALEHQERLDIIASADEAWRRRREPDKPQA